MAPVLELDDVTVELGNVPVLRDISFTVETGETTALIGRNGAGKTTTLSSVMGLVDVKSGTISVNGKDITNGPVHEKVNHGLSLAPEDRRLFTKLSVRKNIQLAAWGNPRDVSDDEFEEIIERVTRVFPEMSEFMDRPAGNLSGGQQKMVTIGRAIASDPELLLLDEPFEGLAPSVRERLINGINRIKEMDVTILIAESNVRYTSQTANHFYVIERGEIVEEITDEDPQENPKVKRIFEGGE